MRVVIFSKVLEDPGEVRLPHIQWYHATGVIVHDCQQSSSDPLVVSQHRLRGSKPPSVCVEGSLAALAREVNPTAQRVRAEVARGP